MVSADSILENIGVALIVCDDQFVVQDVNAACEDLLGISRRSLLNKVLADILVTETNIQAIVKRALSNDSRYTLREILLSHPDGAEVDVTITPFRTRQGTACVTLEINRIDRISRLARESNNIEQQNTNRLMMRSMSHEIKNPLSGLRGAAQLLDAELSNPELKEFTSIIIKEADRLKNLVNRVMGSHRQYDKAPVNIHYVVEHIVRLIEASEGDKLLLHRDYDPSLPELSGDVEQLIQAILNVVKNAVEAQGGGEKIVIGFRTRLERSFTIGKELHRNLIKLQIWDEGQGVPEELQSIVFNPMITGRAEGTGLGLSITQEIIQRHNGLVNLETYKGRTCFAFYLPLQLNKSKEQL